ncbi:EG:100G10.2 [Drosophila simulans]|uniref:RING-type E3 ubiquitin transferase n=2 Tax=Drosophila simulans TaxID=7240 RepID=B4R3T9_DROSI|nr:EG:100G10.2 [Drosophila simulans]
MSALANGGKEEDLKILAQLKSIEQINEQRRIFLNSTINEEVPEATNGSTVREEDLEQNLKGLDEPQSTKVPPEEVAKKTPDEVPAQEQQKEPEKVEPAKPVPPNTLTLNVKYATLPSPNVVTLRSPISPPPKPPMLGRTRSTGPGDGKGPAGNGALSPDSSLIRQSFPEGVITPSKPAKSPATPSEEGPPTTVSARHYEGLIEELRCPGCAGAMKAPILLCKSGHSVCEQCTRILVMCPLCKEPFTTSRSLTVEALCAKAHFRCGHASGGCQVRMPVVLLPWHEQQCMYKPMKCFMGRVWGDCRWQGREVQWKEHLEEEHDDRLFRSSSADLQWNLATRRKPLTGYYVFQAHDEMFNFYEIHDRQRVLFTMTCTSNRRDSKYNYAYEVTVLQPDNEALSMTQKFPVHSEYDKDILMEGTCVSIPLTELNRFLDQDKVLHYRVSVLAVKSPRRAKPPRQSLPQPVDLEQAPNGGVNVKSVPTNMIITRTYKEAIGEVAKADVASPDSEEDPAAADGTGAIGTDGAGGVELERKWGTPQLHFNRKYLRNTLNDATPAEDELRPLAADLRNGHGDDKLSQCSNSTSYTKKVSDSLRRSFRALKADIVELRPFSKKAVRAGSSSPVQTNGK